MMIKPIQMLALAATLSIAPFAAFAEDKTGENLSRVDAAAGDTAVSQAALAQSLFAHAKDSKNAVAALAAAQILQGIDFKDMDRDKTTQDAGTGAEETGEGVDAPADAAMMLASAREYAGGDESILGLIEDAEAEGSRGRIGGAVRHLSRLRAGKMDIYEIPFYGGSLAEVAISGDGDANLDVLIQDENGNTICADVSYSDQFYCSWTPAWNGNFVIGVANQGRIRNSYYFMTN